MVSSVLAGMDTLDHTGVFFRRPMPQRAVGLDGRAVGPKASHCYRGFDRTSWKNSASTSKADTRDWQTSWVRCALSPPSRRELEGGDALDAQDDVSKDGQSLVALIKAGETRTFTLEVRADLDNGAQPGVYGFDLLIREAKAQKSMPVRQPASRGWPTPEANYSTICHPYTPPKLRVREEDQGHAPFFERFLLGFETRGGLLQQILDGLDRMFGAYSPLLNFFCGGTGFAFQWTRIGPRCSRGSSFGKQWDSTGGAAQSVALPGTCRFTRVSCRDQRSNDFRGMKLHPETKMGAPETILGDVRPYTFVVTIAAPDPGALNEEVIHDIITYAKPAHTAYSLRLVKRTA